MTAYDVDDDVANWMRSNRLQLNTADRDYLVNCVHQLPQLPLRVGTDDIIPVTAVRSFGIHIDADVSMRSHVTITVSGCFAVLRQLRTPVAFVDLYRDTFSSRW